MKKIIFTLAMFMVVLGLSAQIYVGGSLGIDKTSGKETEGSSSVDLGSAFTFQLTPKVGYHLNDEISLGIYTGIIKNSITTEYDEDTDIIRSETTWSFGAFGRYNLLGNDNISLLLEGNLGVGGANTSVKRGKNTTQGDPTSIFELQVMPVLSYSLTDRINLEASSDFLRFGFMSITEKDRDDNNYKNTVNHFGLGANSLVTDIEGGFRNPLFKLGVTVNF